MGSPHLHVGRSSPEREERRRAHGTSGARSCSSSRVSGRTPSRTSSDGAFCPRLSADGPSHRFARCLLGSIPTFEAVVMKLASRRSRRSACSWSPTCAVALRPFALRNSRMPSTGIRGRARARTRAVSRKRSQAAQWAPMVLTRHLPETAGNWQMMGRGRRRAHVAVSTTIGDAGRIAAVGRRRSASHHDGILRRGRRAISPRRAAGTAAATMGTPAAMPAKFRLSLWLSGRRREDRRPPLRPAPEPLEARPGGSPKQPRPVPSRKRLLRLRQRRLQRDGTGLHGRHSPQSEVNVCALSTLPCPDRRRVAVKVHDRVNVHFYKLLGIELVRADGHGAFRSEDVEWRAPLARLGRAHPPGGACKSSCRHCKNS